MTAARQLSLAFGHAPRLAGEDFLIAPCNADAVAWIERWPDWPAPVLVLHGPAGCGKTHLGRILVVRAGAPLVTAASLAGEDAARLAAAPVCVVEDADRVAGDGAAEEVLLHLLNLVAEGGGHALVTARAAPPRWALGLADLASRLNAAPAVAVGAPDDALMAALLVKMFGDRQLRVDADVVPYLVQRMERSFAAARQLVVALDAMALAERRNITVPLARRVLEEA